MHKKVCLFLSGLMCVLTLTGCLSKSQQEEASKKIKNIQDEYYADLFAVQKKGFALADDINEMVTYLNEVDQADAGALTPQKAKLKEKILRGKDQLIGLQFEKSRIQSDYIRNLQHTIGDLIDPEEDIFDKDLKQYPHEE